MGDSGWRNNVVTDFARWFRQVMEAERSKGAHSEDGEVLWTGDNAIRGDDH